MCQLLPLVRQDRLLILALLLASVLHEQPAGGGLERAVGEVEVVVNLLDTREPPGLVPYEGGDPSLRLRHYSQLPELRLVHREQRLACFHLVRVVVEDEPTLPRCRNDAADVVHPCGDACLRRRVPLQRHAAAFWEKLQQRKAKSGNSELLDAAAFYTFAFAVFFRHSPSTQLSKKNLLCARGREGRRRASPRQYGEGVCCIPNKGNYMILYSA